jgi:hypothetical protein
MTSKTPGSTNTNFKSARGAGWLYVISLLIVVCLWASQSGAVTSNIVRHSSSTDFLKGEIEDVVIGSKGTLQLGKAWDTPVEQFEDVWSINSIIVQGGSIFIGTSPNGGIFSYSMGRLRKIYPDESTLASAEKPSETEDTNTVDAEQHLANEHIFAMSTDLTGRLLAGISGEKCRLIRFDGEKAETIFEPNDDR